MMRQEIIKKSWLIIGIEAAEVSYLNKDNIEEDQPPTWWAIDRTRLEMRLFLTRDKYLPQVP